MTRSREVSKGATRVEFVYTATSQQTTFSGNDDSSNSLAYTAGQIDVFVNGVRQSAADYTATNGTSVVLGAGASTGDTVNINAFGTFSVADVIVDRLEFDYTATAGQTTFTGSDNDSQTMAYTANRIDVYLNGSRLNVTDDYVATNGTSVVLEAGAQAGDSLVVVSHGTVNLAANIVAGDLDLNGNELILDVDGDTSITSDTDDQIDIKIANADDFKFTANDFTALSGSVISTDTINETTSGSGVTIDSVICKDGTIDVQGNNDAIILDADGDTTISANTDDQIDFEIGDNECVRFHDLGASRQLKVHKGGADELVLQSNAPDASNNLRTLELEGEQLVFSTGASGGTSSTEAFRILADNKICIDSTSAESTSADNMQFDPEGHIYMYQNTADTQGVIDFRNTNGYVGAIRVAGSGTSYVTSSDYRMKDNVNYTWSATDTVKSLKPCSFTFKGDSSTTVHGFIAHELQEHIPQAVNGVKDATKTDGDGSTIIDPQGVDFGKIVPYLVKTIQELEARIKTLEDA